MTFPSYPRAPLPEGGAGDRKKQDSLPRAPSPPTWGDAS